MITGRTVTFPQPRDEDFEDVCWALSAGKSLWERGERDEALKWVRRAANAAAERDADRRAVELFKVAADMASLVDQAEVDDQAPDEDETPTLGSEEAEQAAAAGIGPAAHGPAAHGPAPHGPAALARPAGPRPRSRRHHRLQPPRATLSGSPGPRGAPGGPPRPRPGTGGATRRRRTPTDLSPKVPPTTRISERFGAFELPVDNEEDTFIKPESMLRRALMAIDPDYVRRTEYNDDGSGPDPAFVAPDEEEAPRPPSRAAVPGWGWDDDEDDEGETEALSQSDTDEPEEEHDDLQAETTRRYRPSELNKAPQAAGLDAADTPEQETDEMSRARDKVPSHAAGPMPGGLLTLRVALLPIPEEGDIRIVFLSPDEEPPPGVATALLVPPSEEDARLLATLYGESDNKL